MLTAHAHHRRRRHVHRRGGHRGQSLPPPRWRMGRRLALHLRARLCALRAALRAGFTRLRARKGAGLPRLLRAPRERLTTVGAAGCPCRCKTRRHCTAAHDRPPSAPNCTTVRNGTPARSRRRRAATCTFAAGAMALRRAAALPYCPRARAAAAAAGLSRSGPRSSNAAPSACSSPSTSSPGVS